VAQTGERYNSIFQLRAFFMPKLQIATFSAVILCKYMQSVDLPLYVSSLSAFPCYWILDIFEQGFIFRPQREHYQRREVFSCCAKIGNKGNGQLLKPFPLLVTGWSDYGSTITTFSKVPIPTAFDESSLPAVFVKKSISCVPSDITSIPLIEFSPRPVSYVSISVPSS
jgi:hypothetical protein